MDGFSEYNQIMMAPKDMEKTSFIIEWRTYYYQVMPFGLKNAGATYQRDVTTLLDAHRCQSICGRHDSEVPR